MGICVYCNTKAGMFKDAHEACTKDAEFARESLSKLISDSIYSEKTAASIAPEIEPLTKQGRLTGSDSQLVMLKAADKATLELALKNPIDNDQADRIGDLYSTIDPSWFSDVKKIVNWPGYVALTYSNVLYQAMHGEVPHYDPNGFADFRFQKDEHPILRRNAVLAEYRTITNGRSYQSVGLPIGGGMYYRFGVSQPRTQQSGLMPVDEGLMVITTQGILFSGQTHNFRLPYSSILRIEPFVDGFGIHENHGSGKVFIPAPLGTEDEGWYFHNLVSALSKW
jgi:hypothetical protein